MNEEGQKYSIDLFGSLTSEYDFTYHCDCCTNTNHSMILDGIEGFGEKK
jgi:hypothetical protein